MPLTITLLMAYLSLLSLFEAKIPPRLKIWIFWINAFLFACVAGLRSGVDMPDYAQYEYLYFEMIDSSGSNLMEPTFKLISLFSNFLVSREPWVMFFIYALIGTLFKSWLILRVSIPLFLGQLVYLSNYYIIHELIQIRAGLATCFIALSIIYMARNDRKTSAILLAIATLFHFSSFVFFALMFINFRRFKAEYFLVGLVLSYGLYYFNIDPITLGFNIFSEYLFFVKDAYLDPERASGVAINVVGFFALTRIFIVLFFLVCLRNRSAANNLYLNMSLITFSIGICSYVALARYPEIAVRISYTLMFFEVLLIPFIARMFKPNYLANIIVITFCWISFCGNVFLTQFFSYIPPA